VKYSTECPHGFKKCVLFDLSNLGEHQPVVGEDEAVVSSGCLVGDQERGDRNLAGPVDLSGCPNTRPVIPILIQLDERDIDWLRRGTERQALSLCPHFCRNGGARTKDQNIPAILMLFPGNEPECQKEESRESVQREVPQTNSHNGADEERTTDNIRGEFLSEVHAAKILVSSDIRLGRLLGHQLLSASLALQDKQQLGCCLSSLESTKAAAWRISSNCQLIEGDVNP